MLFSRVVVGGGATRCRTGGDRDSKVWNLKSWTVTFQPAASIVSST